MADQTPTTGFIAEQLRAFNEERDWDQFHDPKSLVLALVGEVGELAELFQWVPAETARDDFSEGDRKQRAAEEIADVATYLVMLSDSLGIEIGAAMLEKLESTRARYSAEEYNAKAP